MGVMLFSLVLVSLIPVLSLDTRSAGFLGSLTLVAAAMGLSYNLGRGLSAAAPYAVGALALRFGIGPAFFLQAAAFLVAAFLALALPETRGRRPT